MPEHPKLNRIMFAVNAGKEGAHALADRLMGVAREMGAEVAATDEYPLPEGFLRQFDACCVIGGDGTILSVVSGAVSAGVPLIGVNAGKLGFLSTLSPPEAEAGLRRILAGHFCLEERSVLACSSGRGFEGHALNDAVIKSVDGRRLIRLAVRCDGGLVTRYSADGLIFSTPTGSTAYNLSAGGPIVAPPADVIIMTPICAHTLTNRSMVFPGCVGLEVESLSPEQGVQVTLDGALRFEGDGGLCLRLHSCKQNLRLLQPADYDYFTVLRTKMNWRGSEL
ncbi:MAG: NAD(+)/NADH kinase [Opitutales bacterium]